MGDDVASMTQAKKSVHAWVAKSSYAAKQAILNLFSNRLTDATTSPTTKIIDVGKERES